MNIGTKVITTEDIPLISADTFEPREKISAGWKGKVVAMLGSYWVRIEFENGRTMAAPVDEKKYSKYLNIEAV